jgi:4-hydroxy-3-methylbut-2-enyl diphosphate reductase
VAAYHIEEAAALLSAQEILHKPAGASAAVVARGWLPEGAACVGITAGASTPNSEVGETIARLLRFRGVDADRLFEAT